MEGGFELNKPGWYAPQNVEENDFLNARLEDDKYGIYYSVKFEGDAETYLWQAKTAPKEGEKYYGHIEQSKSGKSLRFKKDKVPEGQPNPTGQASQTTDHSIARAVALKAAVDLHSNGWKYESDILKTAGIFLIWLQGGGVVDGQEPMPEFPEGESANEED